MGTGITENSREWVRAVLFSQRYRLLIGVSLARQLLKELQTAKITYIDKRDHFVGLCSIYESKVNSWNTFDRSPRIDPKTKNVYSVYFHNNTKGKL